MQMLPACSHHCVEDKRMRKSCPDCSISCECVTIAGLLWHNSAAEQTEKTAALIKHS